MTDSEIQSYLRDNGYPEHVVREGRPGLLRSWRKFVEEVEAGYQSHLEDYWNDLDARGILRLAHAEDPEVLALDERLKKLLIATDRRVWESAPGDPFWDFGYPSNAGPELLAGLRGQGLLES
jgi:hypothetical protein